VLISAFSGTAVHIFLGHHGHRESAESSNRCLWSVACTPVADERCVVGIDQKIDAAFCAENRSRQRRTLASDAGRKGTAMAKKVRDQFSENPLCKAPIHIDENL
jgi:hypothetical protein